MSDASVCPDTGACGYGLWIKSNRGHFKGSGNYREAVEKVDTAEGMALYNAIWLAFRYGLAKKGDRLIIQTDCQSVINSVYGKKAYNPKYLRPLGSKIKKYLNKSECMWEIRYVPAHDPAGGNRNYVNEICDGLAKIAMRTQRAKIRRRQNG